MLAADLEPLCDGTAQRATKTATLDKAVP